MEGTARWAAAIGLCKMQFYGLGYIPEGWSHPLPAQEHSKIMLGLGPER